MKALFVSLFCCLLLSSAFAQKEWSNWYQSSRTLLTFKNGYPQVIHDFITNYPSSDVDFYHYYWWGQAGPSYSDPVTGDMKMIVGNRVAWGSNYYDFPNLDFLRSCPDKFSYHILPFHDNTNRFYVVQFQDASADLLQSESGLQVRCPNAIGLGYSIADLNLNNGFGNFTTTNQQITGNLTGQITTVRHANGKDVWVIVHSVGNNSFMAYLFADAGIQPPVISSVGPVAPANFNGALGGMTAMHGGNMLAGVHGGVKGIQLYDFDNATGKISNYRLLPESNSTSMMQFSPDDSKLYYAGYEGIFQYDFNQPDIASTLTKIYGSSSDYIYDMQLAPDGKIYVTKTTVKEGDTYNEYTGAIQCPNLPQYACNFNPKAIGEIMNQFPDLINDAVKDPKAPPITKFDFGNDTAICFGNFTIKAPAGWETYKWNTGETTKDITVSKPGLYYVIAGSTGFSCPSGYGYINVNDKAVKLDLGKDTLLCPKTRYPFHIDDAYTDILWTNGSNVRDSIITQSGGIIINAKDRNGCMTADTVSISMNYYPRAEFGADTILCNGQTLMLQMEPPYFPPFYDPSFKWSDGTSQTTMTVTKPGQYWGIVSYQGCTVSDTINVAFAAVDNNFLGKDTTLCRGDSLVLKSSLAGTYLWSTGDQSDQVKVKTTGEYWLKVSTSTCAATDTVKVTFNDKPVFSLGNDTTICDKQTLLLNTAITGSYAWQNGSALSSFKVSGPGAYWLKLTKDGCSYADTIKVDYKSLPIISLGNDTTLCEGQPLVLNAFSTDNASYLWQDGSANSQLNVIFAGVYSVKVTGNNSCVNTDTIAVKVTPLPVFSLGNDTTLCDTKTLLYNFSLPGASYLWSDGSTGNSYVVSKPGDYSLRVTQAGCALSKIINVAYKPMPVVNLGNDTVLCRGDILTLNAFNLSANYLWQDNSKQSQFAVTTDGLYDVTVNLNGCIKQDSIKVLYKDVPHFSLGNDTAICRGMEWVLSPVVDTKVSYQWQDGSTQAFYAIKDTGTYAVQVKNECGTTADEIKITAGFCKLILPSAFTPNGDRNNDLFRIKDPFYVKFYNMTVFGRWGEKVFESTDMHKGWDGTYNGVPAAATTYVWVVSLIDAEGKSQSAKGTVVLIR